MTFSALFAGLSGALHGDRHKEIEHRIKQTWGARGVLLTDSGTSALSLAMRLSARAAKPMVAVPAFGCYDLATAADGANARVVLYDLDPHSLAPEPASLERALAHNPTALLLVHLYGIPVDVPALRANAERAGALIIEDAAQAIGATLANQLAGSLGSFAVLSFGRGKGLSGGSGGALLANDAKSAELLETAGPLIAERGAGWSDLVRASAQFVLARPALYGVPAALPFLRLGETIYHAPAQPHALSRTASRVLSSVWQKSLDATRGRRAIARRFNEVAEQSGLWLSINPRSNTEGGYLRLALLTKQRERAQLLNGTAARLGIMPGYPLPLSQLPGFDARVVNAAERFPGAEKLARDLITLPTHALLSRKDQADIEAWLRSQ